MQLQYSQGLIRGQQDPLTSAKLFLQKSGLVVSVYVTDQPLQAVACHRERHYIIAEPVNVSGAWHVDSGECWLYWDINISTAEITRGFTVVEPAYGFDTPENFSADPALDQHYYDTSTMRHYVFDGAQWVEVIRVFAASINSSGVMTPMPFESQVGLTGNFNGGFIIHSLAGSPLVDPEDGTFLNTGSGYMLKAGTNGLVQLDLSYEPLVGIAAESMGALSVVRIDENGLYALADGPSDLPGIALATVGVTQGAAFRPQPAGLVRGNFEFDPLDIGKTAWLGPNGTLLSTRPFGYRSQTIGIILGTDALLLTLAQRGEDGTADQAVAIGALTDQVADLAQQVAEIAIQSTTTRSNFFYEYSFVALGPAESVWDNPISVASDGRFGITYDGTQNRFRNWYQQYSNLVSVGWELIDTATGLPYTPDHPNVNIEFFPTRVCVDNGFPKVEGYLRGELKPNYTTNSVTISLRVVMTFANV